MASETFHELIVKSHDEDCAIIHLLRNVDESMGPFHATNIVPLVTELHKAGVDFLDAMEEIRLKHTSRKIPTAVCPFCHSKYCLGATKPEAVYLIKVPPPFDL